MESALVNFWKFIVVFALLLVFINPIIYIFGLFSWLVASLLNLFSYLGASCSTIESISQVIVGGYPLHEIRVKKDSYLFLLLTRMQDEVHRYTISYHRDIRSKGAIASILDNIDGIGEVRKKNILKKYKTISKMKEASIEELSELMPGNIALGFYEYLRKIDNN